MRAPDTWGGAFFKVAAIAFTTDRKALSARVTAPRAGAVIMLKVESANGGPAVEIAGTTITTANSWQTVLWNLNGVDITKAYTLIAITPDVSLVTAARSYYIDDNTLENASGGGGGGASALTFSAGFSASKLTGNEGNFGGFCGSNQDGFNCNGQPSSCGGGGVFSGDAPTAATGSNYSIALSSFTISQNCGIVPLSVAQALAISPISQVTFKANGGSIALSDGSLTTGANLSVPTGGVYPTTIGINGAITFE